VWSNLIAAALGIAWAYTAYKYNWFNVGGGSSPFMEQWIAASGIVPYIALGTWLGGLSLVIGVVHRLKLSTRGVARTLYRPYRSARLLLCGLVLSLGLSACSGLILGWEALALASTTVARSHETRLPSPDKVNQRRLTELVLILITNNDN
jgi:hypothetical protein